MPRNKHIMLPAPLGFNLTDQPQRTDIRLAQQLSGFSVGRDGILRGTPKLVSVLSINPTDPVDGVAYYYGVSTFSGFDVFGNAVTKSQPSPADDRMLFVSNGGLFAACYQNIVSGSFGAPFVPAYLPMYQTPQAVTMAGLGAFATGQPIRTAQYRTELIICQIGQPAPYRYYQSTNTVGGPGPAGTLRFLGQPTPTAAITGTPTAVAPPYVAKSGIINYSLVYIDEFGRYSSPNLTPLVVDFAAGGYAANPNVTLSVTLPGNLDAQFGTAQIAFLATIQGVPGTYYVLTKPVGGGGSANPQTYTGAGTYTFIDGASDATVAGGIVGPSIGQNDPPNIASWAAVWKNRVVMDNLLDPNGLQISNDGSPTQFNTVPFDPNLPVPTNGLQMEVTQDNGDPIMMGLSFGSLFAILKRHSIFLLYGDDASNFTIQPAYVGIGCAARDSAVRVGGYILFLSDKGVYRWGGGEPQLISHDIEPCLLSYNITQQGAALFVGAKAAYCNDEYTLTIGPDVYVYHNDIGRWTTRLFGADADAFIRLNPPSSISPTIPSSLPLPAGLVDVVPAPRTIVSLSPIAPPAPVATPSPGPTTLFSDTFPEGTPPVNLEDHTPDIGVSWTNLFSNGEMTVNPTGVVRASGSGVNYEPIYYATNSATSADCWVQASLKYFQFSGRTWYIFLRFVGHGSGHTSPKYDCYRFWILPLGNIAALDKVVGGVTTTLVSVNVGLPTLGGAAVVYRMEANGSTITVKADGVVIISVTDSAVTAQGLSGMMGDCSGSQAVEAVAFSCGDL